MTESLMHMNLVKRLREYATKIIEVDNYPFICEDSSSSVELPPILITGGRPDLYYEYDNQLIIGEAKTEKDIRSEHSMKQYFSYLKYCSEYEGDSLLIIAVPWTEVASTKSIMRKIKIENEFCCMINIISNMV